jgi:hypothetical protein
VEQLLLPPDRLADEYVGKIKINCCGTGKLKKDPEGFFSAGIGGPSILNNAPHPNASKVLVNWLLTKEGQTAWLEPLFRSCSARLDMQDKCPREQKLAEGKAFFTFHRRSNVQYRVDAQLLVREIYGR